MPYGQWCPADAIGGRLHTALCAPLRALGCGYECVALRAVSLRDGVILFRRMWQRCSAFIRRRDAARHFLGRRRDAGRHIHGRKRDAAATPRRRLTVGCVQKREIRCSGRVHLRAFHEPEVRAFDAFAVSFDEFVRMANLRVGDFGAAVGRVELTRLPMVLSLDPVDVAEVL